MTVPKESTATNTDTKNKHFKHDYKQGGQITNMQQCQNMWLFPSNSKQFWTHKVYKYHPWDMRHEPTWVKCLMTQAHFISGWKKKIDASHMVYRLTKPMLWEFNKCLAFFKISQSKNEEYTKQWINPQTIIDIVPQECLRSCDTKHFPWLSWNLHS